LSSIANGNGGRPDLLSNLLCRNLCEISGSAN
jgi:hypothetical protein